MQQIRTNGDGSSRLRLIIVWLSIVAGSAIGGGFTAATAQPSLDPHLPLSKYV
ncbi:MAG: hypothetical protein GY953_41770, partial [bacterium]|nr:hypothetical protein [bacterium]